MTPFAGIIRHDGGVVPEDWLRPFQDRCGGRGCRTRFAPSARFVQSLEGDPGDPAGQEGGLGDPPSALPLFLVDATLDDRKELGRALGLADPLALSLSDAALVERAYAQWGEGLAEHLVGTFVIAVWQEAGDRLFLVRDPLGARSLYYHASPTVFAFATELTALLGLGLVPRDLAEERILDVLDRNPWPVGATLYQAVQALPNAQVLTLEHGLATRSAYWVPPDHPPAVSVAGDESYAQGLRDRIRTAVEQQMRPGARIAVHLSGGLDSSTIACIAARKLKQEGRRLLALCSVLPGDHPGPEADERAYIEAVLAQEDNIDPIWIQPPLGVDPFGACPRWYAATGQPCYSNVSHIEELLGEAGRAAGVDLVLSGFGGDLFASIPATRVIFNHLRAGAWRTAMGECLASHREQGTGWARLLAREILAPALRPTLARLRRRDRPGPVHPEFARRMAVRLARSGQRSGHPPQPRDCHAGMRALLAPGSMEIFISSITQVFATEFAQALRFPLLDTRVLEFMLAAPADQLVLGGKPRSLMRRAMAGILPELIRTRPDKGGAFDPAITSRFVHGRPGLVAWAEQTRAHRCWSYVDRQRFLEVLESLAEGPRCQWRQDFFRVVVAGGWMAHFLQLHEQSLEQ